MVLIKNRTKRTLPIKFRGKIYAFPPDNKFYKMNDDILRILPKNLFEIKKESDEKIEPKKEDNKNSKKNKKTKKETKQKSKDFKSETKTVKETPQLSNKKRQYIKRKPKWKPNNIKNITEIKNSKRKIKKRFTPEFREKAKEKINMKRRSGFKMNILDEE